MSLNLYLSELNKSDAIDDEGAFSGSNTAGLTGTNANLYYQAPLADWQRIFKFYTDGGVDITALRKKVVQQKSSRDGGCYAPHTIDFKGRPFDVMSEHSELFCKLQGY